jgi:hypothetical protein
MLLWGVEPRSLKNFSSPIEVRFAPWLGRFTELIVLYGFSVLWGIGKKKWQRTILSMPLWGIEQ